MTEIKSIAGPLRELLAEREIIARCELLLRTYQIVRDAELSEEERAELKALVGERIAPGIFASIMGKDAIFFDLPKLDTYTQMNGRIFHFLHTKKYSKQDFSNAASRFLRAVPELRAHPGRSCEETRSPPRPRCQPFPETYGVTLPRALLS